MAGLDNIGASRGESDVLMLILVSIG